MAGEADPTLLVPVIQARNRLAGFQGDFATFRRTERLKSRLGPTLLGSSVGVEFWTGCLEQGIVEMERFLEFVRRSVPGALVVHSSATFLVGLVADVMRRQEWTDFARAAGARVLRAEHQSTFLNDRVQVGLALLDWHDGDRAASRRHYGPILAAGRFEHHNREFVARAAHGAGVFDEARRHYELALAFTQKGSDRELVRTATWYAQLLLNPEAGQDHTRAREVLELGIATATRIGMLPYLELMQDMQAGLSADMETASEAQPAGLTAREVEVLGYIARGFTGKDIAGYLSLSPKTVETHTSSIYRKIGAANRAEATVFAVRNDLAGD